MSSRPSIQEEALNTGAYVPYLYTEYDRERDRLIALNPGIEAAYPEDLLAVGAMVKGGGKYAISAIVKTAERLAIIKGSQSSLASNFVKIDGGKFDYMFGRVTSGTHNTDRSLQIKDQLLRIGIHDTPSGRNNLVNHFDDVVKREGSVSRMFQTEANGNIHNIEVRESLLSGPGGFLKLESSFEICRMEPVVSSL